MAYHKRKLRNKKPRTLVAKDGEKLQKRVILKVIMGKMVKVHTVTAPAGKGYSEEDIWEIRAHAIDRLDVKFPMFEFNEVEVGKNQFNYILCGTRGVLPQPELIDEPYREPEAAEDAGGNDGVTLRGQIAAALGGGDADVGGSTEDTSGTTESTEDAAGAENNIGEPPNGSDSQESLRREGPHAGGSDAANDADGQGHGRDSV